MKKLITKILLLIYMAANLVVYSQTNFNPYGLNNSIPIEPAKINSKTNTNNLSAAEWTELNPNIPAVDYLGVHFINLDTGWACGDFGRIIKTTNGGQSWFTASSPVNQLLLKIHSFDGQTVIAAGYDKTILRSTDGGENFSQIQTGIVSGTNLWRVKMVSSNTGWICGTNNTLLKTTNGGLTWQSVTTPGYTSDFWGIDFLDANRGFIAATGKVLLTTDGGESWGVIPAGDASPLISIHAIDSLHVAASGYGTTGYPAKNIYSSNGGFIWVTGGALETKNANCIRYVNRDTGYVVQTNSGLYKTTNRGQTWNHITNNIGEYDFTILQGNTGYSVGTSMKILKAENNFDVWNQVIIRDNLKDVFFFNETKGFAVSPDNNGILYKSEDEGASWEKVANAPGGNVITFTDNLTGFIGSREVGATTGKIHKTTNGGANWYVTNIANHIGSVNKIFFINHSTGWAVSGYSTSSQAKILHTNDGGENWAVQQEMDNSTGFTSVFFLDSQCGWVTGRNIWQTTNGGTNWIKRLDVPDNFFSDIYFSNALNGWAIASSQMYKTTDGGNNWILSPPSLMNSTNFETLSDSHFVIAGQTILESTDAGATWQNITDEVGKPFISLHAPKTNLAFCVGNNGLIMRYNNTSSIPVELLSFTGSLLNNGEIELCWSTASETNNKGFKIERSEKQESGSGMWEKVGFVEGKGTSIETNNYSFVDKNINAAKYIYRLKQIDFDGSFSYSKEIEVDVTLPERFMLYQNYPNPFNPVTTIRFAIPTSPQTPLLSKERGRGEVVTLKVYDMLGREVAVLVNEEKQPGTYEVKWDATGFSSGIYFYRLFVESVGKAGSFIEASKMILTK